MNKIRITIMSAVVLMASHQTQAQYWTTPAPVTLPSIPSGTYNITAYGAATSSANNASAIQAAITAAATAGGGTVQVPAGTFLSGPITLRSKINLNLASGATLKMLPYGTWPGSTVFISGSHLSNVEISGSGTIDGQGQAWWNAFDVNRSLVRPQEVVISSSGPLEITGIHLQNSPVQHVMLSYVTNVTVSGISIYTVPASGQSVAFNTDGVDISAAQHVYFNNNNITCGDDNVVTEGYYIDVENCTFGAGHGCSIGSYTTAGVAFVTVHNCTFSGTTSGIRMKSERARGGDVQYLAYNNNTMTGVGTPVSITSYYPSDRPNPTTNATQTVTSTTPIWKHIKIQTLTATGSANCGSLYGLPEEAITDMTFNNVKISGTTGLKIYFANAIVFTNGSSITPSSGNAVTIYKATVTGITTHNYP